MECIRAANRTASIADDHQGRHPEAKSRFTGCAATPLAQNLSQLIPERPPPGNVARLPCGGLI